MQDVMQGFGRGTSFLTCDEVAVLEAVAASDGVASLLDLDQHLRDATARGVPLALLHAALVSLEAKDLVVSTDSMDHAITGLGRELLVLCRVIACKSQARGEARIQQMFRKPDEDSTPTVSPTSVGRYEPRSHATLTPLVPN